MGAARTPERGHAPLVLALVAPTGTPRGEITAVLRTSLEAAGYVVDVVRVVDHVPGGAAAPDARLDERTALSRAACRALRASAGTSDAVALAAIAEIARRERAALASGAGARRRAYLVRSVKRPEEVDAFRSVYGDAFVLVGLIATPATQFENLVELVTRSTNGVGRADAERVAGELMTVDSGTEDDEHGPAVQRAYHRADVFLHAPLPGAAAAAAARADAHRFVKVMLGALLETPTRDEVAMAVAEAASMRSGFLQRQVGVALTDPVHGSVLATGCNDVPAPGGGLYWAGDTPDERDNVRGVDRSYGEKLELMRDAYERLLRAGWLDLSKLPPGADPAWPPAALAHLLVDAAADGSPALSPLSQSRMMDTLEFHRAVHAEMAAITDAARRGVAVQDAFLYTTTFPCHICAKHIVASGVGRVVYIEPYPRSHAATLHDDAIELTDDRDRTAVRGQSRVPFVPYIGIAPRRYRQFFGVAPGERRATSGRAVDADIWRAGRPRWEQGGVDPLLDAVSAVERAERAVAAVLALLG